MIARALTLFIALGAIAAGVWHLERARAGIVISDIAAGTTPATVYRARTTT